MSVSVLMSVCMYIYMLNKNTLGVKKVRGQSEATCKQAGATESFDISSLWPSDKANREKYTINYCMSFKELKSFFDKLANFLASADIKAFGCACLLACCF